MARPGDIDMHCLPILRVCKDRGILRWGLGDHTRDLGELGVGRGALTVTGLG
jgi:hypothetical protein